ncbi:response regulator [Paenibacillus agricola]|uniref:Response regulator n=1 Tax=Paenibacillus agricola TaxID=2716264 RepID=A0ABX0IYF9_9BACL|nr:response regulator [Paenibacillus agricola]NHN29000.1 response regulator [Paenibacillus agricola]
MRLLIVEDEHYVRERIEGGIDWAANEIECAAAVGSSREALTILQKDHIDIVLTDIQMPEMSGLELAKWLKDRFPLIKVIILTGYDDFEYARESIEYGVFKYLVKPAENELILETVLNAKAVREKEIGERHNISLLEKRWNEHLPHLQVTFVKNWINGRYSIWEIEKRSQDLLMQLEEKRYLPVIFDMDPISEENGRFQVRDRSLVQFLLVTIAGDVLDNKECVILQDDDGMTAVVFFLPADEPDDALYARVNPQINGLLSTVKDCLKLTASAGIGPLVSDKLLLANAYSQSRMALQERIILGNAIAIPYRDAVPIKDSWMHMNHLEKEFEVAIETGDGSKCEMLIQQVMELGFSADKPVTEAKEMLWRLTCLLARIVHTHGWTLRETLKVDYEDFESFNQLLSREHVGEWLRRMTSRISQTISERRQTGTQLAMSQIILFIQERLHDEGLNLYLVAEKMFISYSYLSRAFKEATGESFSDYVLRLRMERAKELLAKGFKVYDAAEQVGYRHVNYFSKSFQKYWGVKPSEIYK